MAKVKEAQVAKEDILENIQKLVLCGRAMLDAIEDLTTLYFCSAADSHAAVQGLSTAAPLSPQTCSAGLSTGKGAKESAESETSKPQEAEAPKPARLEEVRGLLAEKSRSGFRAEVKALLSAHGVEKLSEVTDPAELGKLLEEARLIGAADG